MSDQVTDQPTPFERHRSECLICRGGTEYCPEGLRLLLQGGIPAKKEVKRGEKDEAQLRRLLATQGNRRLAEAILLEQAEANRTKEPPAPTPPQESQPFDFEGLRHARRFPFIGRFWYWGDPGERWRCLKEEELAGAKSGARVIAEAVTHMLLHRHWVSIDVRHAMAACTVCDATFARVRRCL